MLRLVAAFTALITADRMPLYVKLFSQGIPVRGQREK